MVNTKYKNVKIQSQVLLREMYCPLGNKKKILEKCMKTKNVVCLMGGEPLPNRMNRWAEGDHSPQAHRQMRWEHPRRI